MLTRSDDETAEVHLDAPAPPAQSPEIDLIRVDRPRRHRLRLPAGLRAGTAAWTWIGVALIATGFVLLAVAWGQVAGETEVYLQLPYLVSAGVVGLGVVMLGLAVVNVTAGQQDAAAREHEMEQLLAALDELQQALAQPRRRGR